ncbi:MAG: cbb3-type cytochrome c oxidase subunit I [Thermaerobacter sp.]|nr:cbb3-type cytochrome c oxidase subunit I [Thermaerobacter sp.]
MFFVDRQATFAAPPPFVTEPAVTVGWVLALIGWLGGVGGYEAVVLPWLGIERPYLEARGWRRYFALSLDSKVVGVQYLVGSIGTFGIAGLTAMGIRAQLMGANAGFFSTDVGYFSAVTIHGVLMILGVAVVGFVGGFGNYFVPLMIGARSRMYPRLGGSGLLALSRRGADYLSDSTVGRQYHRSVGLCPVVGTRPVRADLLLPGNFCDGDVVINHVL